MDKTMKDVAKVAEIDPQLELALYKIQVLEKTLEKNSADTYELKGNQPTRAKIVVDENGKQYPPKKGFVESCATCRRTFANPDAFADHKCEK